LLQSRGLVINFVSIILLIFFNEIVFCQDSQKNNFIELGIQQYKQNKYKQAMETFMQAILTNPENKKAREYLRKSAEKYLSSLKNETIKEREAILNRAKKYQQEQENKNYTEVKNLYLVAKDEYKKGKYLRAFSKFKEINRIKNNYKDTEYYVNLINREMNEISKIETYSDIELLFYAKAFVFYNNKEYVNAINEWEKLLNVNPNNEEVKEFYENTKKLLHEIIEEERTKKIKSMLEDLNNQAIENFRLKNYKTAIKLWEKTIQIVEQKKIDELNKFSEEAKKNIKMSLLEIKKIIDKDTSVKEITIDEESAEKHYTQGLVYYSAGYLNDAIKEWEISLKYNPNFEKAKKAKERAEEEVKIQK